MFEQNLHEWVRTKLKLPEGPFEFNSVMMFMGYYVALSIMAINASGPPDAPWGGPITYTRNYPVERSITIWNAILAAGRHKADRAVLNRLCPGAPQHPWFTIDDDQSRKKGTYPFIDTMGGLMDMTSQIDPTHTRQLVIATRDGEFMGHVFVSYANKPYNGIKGLMPYGIQRSAFYLPGTCAPPSEASGFVDALFGRVRQIAYENRITHIFTWPLEKMRGRFVNMGYTVVEKGSKVGALLENLKSAVSLVVETEPHPRRRRHRSDLDFVDAVPQVARNPAPHDAVAVLHLHLAHAVVFHGHALVPVPRRVRVQEPRRVPKVERYDRCIVVAVDDRVVDVAGDAARALVVAHEQRVRGERVRPTRQLRVGVLRQAQRRLPEGDEVGAVGFAFCSGASVAMARATSPHCTPTDFVRHFQPPLCRFALVEPERSEAVCFRPALGAWVPALNLGARSWTASDHMEAASLVESEAVSMWSEVERWKGGKVGTGAASMWSEVGGRDFLGVGSGVLPTSARRLGSSAGSSAGSWTASDHVFSAWLACLIGGRKWEDFWSS